MHKWIVTALSVLIFLTCSPLKADDARVITIAAEGASPPWTGTDESGQLYGFDVDVGRDLCLRMKVKCAFVAQDWDGIIPALTVGKFDVIMSGMSITEKRKRSIAFTIPYAGGFNQFVVRKSLGLTSGDTRQKLNLSAIGPAEKQLIDTLRETLAGKTLGVLRSSNSEAVLKDLLGDVLTIRSYDSQNNLQLDLAAGRIDGGLADYFTWRDFLKSADGNVATFYGPELSGGLWGPGVGAGLRKEDRELLTRFNAAIEDAVKDGTIRSLSLKWFEADISPSFSK